MRKDNQGHCSDDEVHEGQKKRGKNENTIKENIIISPLWPKDF